MRWLAHSSIGALIFCASCAVVPPSPSLPIGEFVEQVLDPLSGKIADERIQHAQAELKAGQLSPGLLSFLGLAFGPGGAVAGNSLATLGNASLDQKSAQLETRKLPLKNEILTLLTKRTQVKGENYAVCVEQVERLYGVQDGRFVRLADGPGPCETTRLETLAKGGAN